MTQRRPPGQRAAAPGGNTLSEISPICHPTGCFSFTATQVQMTLQKAQGLPENIPPRGWRRVTSRKTPDLGGDGSPGETQPHVRKNAGPSRSRLLSVVCRNLRDVSEATQLPLVWEELCGTSFWSDGSAADWCVGRQQPRGARVRPRRTCGRGGSWPRGGFAVSVLFESSTSPSDGCRSEKR